METNTYLSLFLLIHSITLTRIYIEITIINAYNDKDAALQAYKKIKGKHSDYNQYIALHQGTGIKDKINHFVNQSKVIINNHKPLKQ